MRKNPCRKRHEAQLYANLATRFLTLHHENFALSYSFEVCKSEHSGRHSGRTVDDTVFSDAKCIVYPFILPLIFRAPHLFVPGIFALAQKMRFVGNNVDPVAAAAGRVS